MTTGKEQKKSKDIQIQNTLIINNYYYNDIRVIKDNKTIIIK